MALVHYRPILISCFVVIMKHNWLLFNSPPRILQPPWNYAWISTNVKANKIRISTRDAKIANNPPILISNVVTTDNRREKYAKLHRFHAQRGWSVFISAVRFPVTYLVVSSTVPMQVAPIIVATFTKDTLSLSSPRKITKPPDLLLLFIESRCIILNTLMIPSAKY